MTLSTRLRLGAMPVPYRSSGTKLTPLFMTSSGVLFVMSCPRRDIVPEVVFLRPVMTSVSSRCPFPATPAMPRISPALTSRETPSKATVPRSPYAVTSESVRTGAVSSAVLPGRVGEYSLPTIRLASCLEVTSVLSAVAATRPARSTVTLSATCITSSSL